MSNNNAQHIQVANATIVGNGSANDRPNFGTTTDNCCFFLAGTDPENTLNRCNTKEDRANLSQQLNHYKTRDVQFLYFVTAVFIFTFVGALFSFAGNDATKVQMKNLVIWGSSFSLFVVGMRIYFFKMYIQNALISTFRIDKADLYDKFMNLFFVLWCLGLVGTFVAMFKFASDFQQLKSVIAMCVLIAQSIFATFWYKLIVHRMARRVVDHILPQQGEHNV